MPHFPAFPRVLLLDALVVAVFLAGNSSAGAALDLAYDAFFADLIGTGSGLGGAADLEAALFAPRVLAAGWDTCWLLVSIDSGSSLVAS